MTPHRRKQLLALFAEANPSPKTELLFSTDFQLLISVILSAQTTDKKVNEVTAHLFARYPTAKDLSLAQLSHVESFINTIN